LLAVIDLIASFETLADVAPLNDADAEAESESESESDIDSDLAS
jgi:hypothetical protein